MPETTAAMKQAATSSDDGDDTRTARVLAALSFAVTVILVGVPVWLKTTETYRAPIPHDGIASLQQLSLDVSTGARLQVLAPTAAGAERLAADLQRHLAGVNVTWRATSEREAAVLAAAADPWAAEDALNAESAAAETGLRVVVLPARPAAAAAAPILFGRRLDVLVTPTADAAQLARALREAALGADSEPVSTRRVRAAPDYDLLLSLVVPQPADAAPLWDGAAVAHRLAPLAARLRPLANLTVKSQHLYHAGLGVRSSFDAAAGEHFLTEEQLSLVITPLEARLGAAVFGRPTLHFVVYVPPPALRPLRVRPAGAADAFLSPRWGGVQVYNPPPGAEAVDAARVAAVMVAQLRLLLGVPETPAGAAARPAGPAGLRGWELVALRRRRCVENVDGARRNLASLAAMLEQISNIVIDEAVGTAVRDGVAAAEEAARLLADGREAEAYACSCRALANSERAIFDPSMLALLYFPDDQKYAIYIPLFLPVSIPVLMSLKVIWGWARGVPEKVKTE